MSSRLRVAIVLDSMIQPAWVCRVVASIRKNHHLAFAMIVPPSRPQARPPLMARLFQLVDDAVFGRATDGAAPCDLREHIHDAPLASALDEHPADIVLAFAPAESGRAEVWSVELDGLPEFARRKPFMEAVLRSRQRLVSRTTAMAETISFRRARNRLGLRAASMIEHELDRRARDGAAPPVRVPERAALPPVGNARMLVRAVSAARAWATEQYREKFLHRQWSVAFTFDVSAHRDFRRFHPVDPPPDRIWADPFVIGDGDRAWIFVEEMLFSDDRGVISVIEAHRDGTWSPPQRILERPYHLSYPCVFRWNGELFMVPDTLGNGTIELYRCVDVPLRWELDTVLMTGMNAVDATVFELEGRWWMYFATPSGDLAGLDRLWLYHAPSPRGPWTAHRWNPLECDVVGGRAGGGPFRRDGRLLRPVQIGTPYYGHSIGLREIVRLTPDEWEEPLVDTIAPDWSEGLTGTHTLNVDGDVAVVDVSRFRRIV